MELTQYVERYRLAHDIEPGTVGQLRNAANLITRFAGGQLAVESLCDETVNRWLLGRREAGLSPETVRGNRTSILMLWRAAAEEGLVGDPGKICRIKRRERVVRAFTMDEVQALLRAADRLGGVYRPFRVPRCLYMRSFVSAAYDTGLRLSDLLKIARRDIWWPGSQGTAILTLVQTKTRHRHMVHLREGTMREIELVCAAGKPREADAPIWGPVSKRHMYVRIKRLCALAGVQGTSKLIRRSSASYVAREFGDAAASAFLGHRSPELFKRNYEDANITRREALLPPPLG